MPVSKPGTLPRWSEETGGTQHNISPAPSSGRQDVGWLPDDEVFAQWLNWWMNLVYRWLAYVNDLENQALTIVGAWIFSTRPTFNDGILVNAAATSNRPGIDSTGKGTGAAYKGAASSTSGSSAFEGVGAGNNPAARLTGAGNGPAVLATGGSSDGAGGDFTSGGNAGTAVIGRGSGTNGGGGQFLSAGNGVAIDSSGSGTSPTIQAIAAGSGVAVEANASAGSGYGARFSGNATKAATRFIPQNFTAGTGPSSPLEGDEFYNGTDHKKYLYNGTAWVVVGSQS